MRLVINASDIGRQRGGNESYMRGLISGLAQCAPSPDVHLLTNSWYRAEDDPLPFEHTDLGKYRPLRFWTVQQQRYLRKLNADWYISNFFLPPDMPCKTAVVVHDMSFCAHPEYFPKHIALYMQWITHWSAQKADVVVAISEFTKQEIIHYWDIDPAKIVVIHNGITDDFHKAMQHHDDEADTEVLKKYGVDKPYILALGNIHPRKNLGLLLEAYRELKATGKTLPALVWGGMQHWDVNDLVNQAKAEGVHLIGYVDQADLPALYRQAMAFVYPSLYEGFGLPPVEAMACGTPVITSNNSSLPEVVGDAALLISPYSKDDLTLALERLVDQEDLRAKLREAGLEQAKRYNWVTTANALISELEKRT